MQIADLIYGTFPDLPGSQQIVHQSDSISDDLKNWLINSYEQFGDCRSEEFRSSTTVMWYRPSNQSSLACVTRITQQDKDFSGRWGALLRHTAVLTEEQYRQHGCLPVFVASRLVEEGSSQELQQRHDLRIELATALKVSMLVTKANFADYRKHLESLLAGNRLVLYADSNPVFLRDYLNTLVALLPLKARLLLNWSQFVFRSWETIDLSVIFNSRYEAPTEGVPEFVADGTNSLTSLELTQEDVSDYLGRLEAALKDHNERELAVLLDSGEWREDNEPSGQNLNKKESDES